MSIKIPLNRILFIMIVGTVVALAALSATATSPGDIEFPVAELDGCQNQQLCRLYCDAPENIDQCIAFAEKHNLIDQTQASEARRFAAIIRNGGPGGCRTAQECETFCSDENNLSVCFEFASRHGLARAEDAQRVQRISQVLRSGTNTPGGCRSAESCHAYCSASDHMEECIAFGRSAGLMSDEEAERARRMAQLLKNRETPGRCSSPDVCQTYCEDQAHLEECGQFAERSGILTPEEIEKFRRTGGRGPGGCRGTQECERFCNDPARRDVCLQFAQEHDLFEDEALEQIRTTSDEIRSRAHAISPEVSSCLKEAVGEDVVSRVQDGTFVPSPELAQRMHQCLQRFLETVPAAPSPFVSPRTPLSSPSTPESRIEIKIQDSSAQELEKIEREFEQGFENYPGYYTNLPEPTEQRPSSFFQRALEGLSNLLRGW